MNKAEAKASIGEMFHKNGSRKKKKRAKRKNKKKTIIMAESTKEAEKDIEVNKGSFNANKDIGEQVWDFLDIK